MGVRGQFGWQRLSGQESKTGVPKANSGSESPGQLSNTLSVTRLTALVDLCCVMTTGAWQVIEPDPTPNQIL